MDNIQTQISFFQSRQSKKKKKTRQKCNVFQRQTQRKNLPVCYLDYFILHRCSQNNLLAKASTESYVVKWYRLLKRIKDTESQQESISRISTAATREFRSS